MQQTTNTIEGQHAPIALDDLFPAEELAARFPRLLSVRTLQWQLRNRDTNGLSHAVVRIGKRLMISQSRYEAWLATRAGATA